MKNRVIVPVRVGGGVLVSDFVVLILSLSEAAFNVVDIVLMWDRESIFVAVAEKELL